MGKPIRVLLPIDRQHPISHHVYVYTKPRLIIGRLILRKVTGALTEGSGCPAHSNVFAVEEDDVDADRGRMCLQLLRDLE